MHSALLKMYIMPVIEGSFDLNDPKTRTWMAVDEEIDMGGEKDR